ncbi:hypothetical protein ACCS55_15895 [Rhizobium ruizarguesonis]
MTDSEESLRSKAFEDRELDKLIRQILDKVRRNYFENGETARGIPSEIKKIIEANMDRF